MSDVVDRREVLDQVISDASFEAESKQCVVHSRFPDSIPVKGDQELLFRALENVVRNAVLHSPSGKEVKLVVLRDSADRWVITVADQGPGVPLSDMEAIFQPFFRSKASTTYSGYGLGLAITRRVVQVHGGSVTAANRAQGGLLVTIILPAV
jgi:two-component system OmpR family sensor kinase